jgi:hypothetical protein
MLKKAIILTLLTSLLSACVTGPEGYLKRSANNKIFDRQGFKGGKRAPLYNKTYVAQAKKNILNDNIEDDMDDDEFNENENPSRDNIEMYKAMIDADLEKERRKNNKSSWWWSKKKKKQSYPSVVDASKKVDPSRHAQNLELREELDQIKSMLNDTKKEMASYKCPTAQEQEKRSSKKHIKTEESRPRETLDRRIPQDLEQKTKEIITEKHVHSI